MRNPIIFILAVMIVAVAVIPEISDAERPANEPTEPAILCYYWGSQLNLIETHYVIPDLPIGSQNIAELTWPGGCWVRMDTGEVVTEDTVFAPGTYMIKAYSNTPTPWGASSTSSAPDNTLPVTAIVLSAVAIITSGVAIVMLMRKK